MNKKSLLFVKFATWWQNFKKFIMQQFAAKLRNNFILTKPKKIINFLIFFEYDRYFVDRNGLYYSKYLKFIQKIEKIKKMSNIDCELPSENKKKYYNFRTYKI